MKNEVYELTNLKKKYPGPYNKKESIPAYMWEVLNVQKILISTNKKNKKIKSTKSILPKGLKICDIKPYKNDKKILKEFIKFFNNYMKNKIKNNMFISYEIFTILNKQTKTKHRLNIRTSFDIINKSSNNQFIKIIKYYFNNVLKCFNINPKKDKKIYNKILDEGYMGIFKYNIKKKPGLPCHTDNFDIANNKSDIHGPLITINIGQDIYYDFIPLFFKNKTKYKDVRMKVHDNQIIIMDGNCRINWQHCVPYGYIRRDKITIKFKFPCLGKYNSEYNEFFDMNISTSYKK